MGSKDVLGLDGVRQIRGAVRSIVGSLSLGLDIHTSLVVKVHMITLLHWLRCRSCRWEDRGRWGIEIRGIQRRSNGCLVVNGKRSMMHYRRAGGGEGKVLLKRSCRVENRIIVDSKRIKLEGGMGMCVNIRWEAVMQRCLVEAIVSDANITVSDVGIHVAVNCGDLRRRLSRSFARLFNRSAKDPLGSQ